MSKNVPTPEQLAAVKTVLTFEHEKLGCMTHKVYREHCAECESWTELMGLRLLAVKQAALLIAANDKADEMSRNAEMLRQSLYAVEEKLTTANARVTELGATLTDVEAALAQAGFHVGPSGHVGRHRHLPSGVEHIARQRDLATARADAAERKVGEASKLVHQLSEALDRVMLYVELHAQAHPEWNGNRFDDTQLAEAALAAAKVRE